MPQQASIYPRSQNKKGLTHCTNSSSAHFVSQIHHTHLLCQQSSGVSHQLATLRLKFDYTLLNMLLNGDDSVRRLSCHGSTYVDLIHWHTIFARCNFNETKTIPRNNKPRLRRFVVRLIQPNEKLCIVFSCESLLDVVLLSSSL